MPLKLLSNQVNEREIAIIIRELDMLIKKKTVGDIVEFGCFVGTTSTFLLEKIQNTERRLWLYDSFEGLPEKTREDASSAGEQFKAGELRAARKQLEHNLRRFNHSSYIVKKAWFSDLTTKEIPDKIALAFLDGDYYQSILDPLRLIWDHLVPGGVVIVDDYDNPALPGAAKAVDRWVERHNLSLRQEQGLALFKKPLN